MNWHMAPAMIIAVSSSPWFDLFSPGEDGADHRLLGGLVKAGVLLARHRRRIRRRRYIGDVRAGYAGNRNVGNLDVRQPRNRRRRRRPRRRSGTGFGRLRDGAFGGARATGGEARQDQRRSSHPDMRLHLRNDRRKRDVAWEHARGPTRRTRFATCRRTRMCRSDLRGPTAVLHGIADDDLAKQTPCREFDVAALTDHLMNSITVIGGAAGAELPNGIRRDSVERQVVLAARPALDAWKRRGLDGNVAFGSNEAPAKMMAGILCLEFLVHAWDYAAALGREVLHPTRCRTTSWAWRAISSRLRAAPTSASTTRSRCPTTLRPWTSYWRSPAAGRQVESQSRVLWPRLQS